MEPRITLITLGVADLPRAVRFYRDGLGWPTIFEVRGLIAFINTIGTRLALYPDHELAADISPDLQPARAGLAASPWDTASAPRRKWPRCWRKRSEPAAG